MGMVREALLAKRIKGYTYRQALRKRTITIFLAAVLLLLAACKNDEPQGVNAPGEFDGSALVTASPSSMPEPTPSPTPEPTAQLSPSPTPSTAIECNLYVDGALISKLAYLDTVTGRTMLPVQETFAALGVETQWNAAANMMALLRDGEEIGMLTPDTEGRRGYLLREGDETVPFPELLELSARSGSIYAPSMLFMYISSIELTSNEYGDILITMRTGTDAGEEV